MMILFDAVLDVLDVKFLLTERNIRVGFCAERR